MANEDDLARIGMVKGRYVERMRIGRAPGERVVLIEIPDGETIVVSMDLAEEMVERLKAEIGKLRAMPPEKNTN